MLPVARHFKDRGWRVHILIGWSGPSADDADLTCREFGAEISRVPASLNYGDHFINPATKQSTQEAPVDRTGARRTAKWLKTKAPRSSRRLVMAARKFQQARQAKSYTKTEILTIKPDVIFGGPWTSLGTFDNGIALWAKNLGIPYLCLSFSTHTGKKYNTNGRFNNLKSGMVGRYVCKNYDIINRILSIIFRSWTRTDGSETIFFWDPIQILAARLSNMVEPDPWQKPSEKYDLFFVFSEYSKTLLVEAGHDSNKIVVAGMPILDNVFDGLKSDSARLALYESLNLSPDERFILWNIEPGLEHSYTSHEDHWRRFNEQLSALKETGMKVVLSLHPLCKIETYEFVEQDDRFKISRTHTIHQLYPYCAFVLSHPCSTNFMASQFGKPLVIFDYHGLTTVNANQEMFTMPNALYVHSADGFKEQLTAARALPANARPKTASVPASEIIFYEVHRRFLEPHGKLSVD